MAHTILSNRFIHERLQTQPENRFAALAESLNLARDEVLADDKLFKSQSTVPECKQPLDAGFVTWPEDLLKDMKENGAESLIVQIEQCAARLSRTSAAHQGCDTMKL